MSVQITVYQNLADKQRRGVMALSLDSLTSTGAVTIKSGSVVEVAGSLYEFQADETESGGTWAAIGASNVVYLYVVPAGSSATFIYSTTAPTWDSAKAGWYTAGTSRCVAYLYKDSGGLYTAKNMMPGFGPGKRITLLTGAGPYTLTAFEFDIIAVLSTTNPCVINLPSALTCCGWKPRIVNLSVVTANPVKILPFTGESIGSLSLNMAVYLDNVDQGGNVYLYQFIELEASIGAIAKWAVTGGQFCPEPGSVDTGGKQYHLGKLHHLPLGNATSRQLSYAVPPNVSAWSAAITAIGSAGIPAGAKAIRVKVFLIAFATAAGVAQLTVAFSDNNSSTPAAPSITAHPTASNAYYAGGAATLHMYFEIDIPLNSSGQFYIYTLEGSNITLASSAVGVYAVGYYMGD